MTPTMNEDFEVPDAEYGVLNDAAWALGSENTYELNPVDSANLDLMIAGLLTAMHARAAKIADSQPIPGKVRNSVLEENIPGYREARELAVFVKNTLGQSEPIPYDLTDKGKEA